MRSGVINITNNDSQAVMYETTTDDIGDTNNISISVDTNLGYVRLKVDNINSSNYIFSFIRSQLPNSAIGNLNLTGITSNVVYHDTTLTGSGLLVDPLGISPTYFANPRISETFVPATGIQLDRVCTHYNPYTVNSDITLIITSGATVDGSAEIEFIGNGTNTIDFSAFTQFIGSDTFDNTNGKRNQVFFDKLQNSTFYSIKILN
jgi:hypothetical protein